MKKNRIISSFISLLLCFVTVFSSCADDQPVNGEGGSDIVPENTVETTEATTSAPKYSAEDKLIALTFDDGPSKKTTNRILDILEENGSAATFFLVGYNIENNVSTIKRAQKLGCEIANHSKDHKNLTKCSVSEIHNQVNKPNELLKSLTGVSPKLFRAPGGNFKGVEDEIGMPLIQWTIDTEDWKYKDASNEKRTEKQRKADLEKIAKRVADSAESGDIVLMHDIYIFTADLCEILVPALIEKGFKLVTVSELYEANSTELKNGKVYRGKDFIPTNTKPIEIGNYKVKTNGGHLNVRAKADYNSDSLEKIPNGTSIVVLRSVPGWAYVEYNSVQGWVNTKFLEKA